MLKRLLFFCLLLINVSGAFAQDKKAEKDNNPPSSRADRIAAKKKWKENRIREYNQKKMVKDHHKRIQTKATRKRMKKNRKKSEQGRQRKKRFFLFRWFGA